MAEIKTIYKGESVTLLFTFPEAYDMARLASHKIFVGETEFTGVVEGQAIKMQLKSSDTNRMIGTHRIVCLIDDTTLGLRKPYCGELVIAKTQASGSTTSVSNISDIIIPVVISETAITVGDILYNYVKGDKGDPFTYSDFTPEQIEALKVKGDAFEYSDFTPEQIALLQKPASDIATTVSNAEGLRVTAETNRNNAEGLRLSAETTRGENETDRIEAEGLRAGAETGRQSAEALRVTAEQDRQTNTATAIQNAETATTGANNAASLANEKAGLANDAALLANEVASNPDKIVADYWYKWNTNTKTYENTGLKAKGDAGTTLHTNLTDKNDEAAFQHVDERINEIPAEVGAASYMLLNRRQNLITGTLPNWVNSTLVLPALISGGRNEVVLHFKTNAIAAPTLVYSGFTPVWLNGTPISMKVNKQYTIVFEQINGIVKTSWGEY